MVTRYCALELWQHQLITSVAKDRLYLNPPAHGWLTCFRREALDQIGGFALESLGEDAEATNALVRAGWRTRFIPSARVSTHVPRSVADYFRQHVRWSRGLHEAMAGGAGEAMPTGRLNARVPFACQIEMWMHAAGYLDRLLLAAGGFAATHRLSPWLPAGYVGLLVAESGCALAAAGHLRSSPRFVVAAAVMIVADLAASASGTALHLRRADRRWGAAARRGAPSTVSRSRVLTGDQTLMARFAR